MGGLQDNESVRLTEEVLSVAEVTAIIKEVLDDDRLRDIWVRGEVANFKCHSSGHCYFSLSEQRAGKTYAIDCIMWRTDASTLNFTPSSGIDVIVFGYVDHYPPQGRTQFYVRTMRQAGEGEKHLLVERWKRELAIEGLFALERKRPLPEFPVRVGVVTSPTGAVIEDIKNVIRRRFPVEIILSPTAVQGDNAHREIATAIHRLEGLVDVIIVARGGGSFEDLFPFNHPEVIRAVAASRCPVVSAIGHEVDVTLCDLVADVRAPTPSAAAELVVKDRSVLRDELKGFWEILSRGILERLDQAAREVEELCLHLHPRRLQRRVSERRQELEDFAENLHRTIDRKLERERLLLGQLFTTLEAANPIAPLDRGYCLAMKDGKILRSARELEEKDDITLKMRDGAANVRVEKVSYE